jgi:hypothetical protein
VCIAALDVPSVLNSNLSLHVTPNQAPFEGTHLTPCISALAVAAPERLNGPDLTAFFVPVDLRELTLTEGAEDGETWIRSGTDCFEVKAD